MISFWLLALACALSVALNMMQAFWIQQLRPKRDKSGRFTR